jgi:hypothetical protein
MSLEDGNRRKSPITLAVTAGYFFSLKKIMRENLVSAIQRTVRVTTDQHVYACRSLQINIVTYPLTRIICRYFPLIGDEIVDGEGLNYPGYIFSVFFYSF